jgi:hypothetical protein
MNLMGDESLDLSSLERIIRKVNEGGIRYLIAGELAVVAHGYVRFTADIDLFLELNEANLLKATSIFTELSYRPRAPAKIDNFSNDSIRTSWAKDRNMKVFSLWNPDDPFTEIDLSIEAPLDFESAFGRKQLFEIGPGFIMPVVGLEDLKTMKLAAGRRKDLDDIENLEKLKDWIKNE